MLKLSADFVAARVGRLATCSAAGQPHCVPVCFAVCSGELVIALDEKPKRVDVLRLKRVRNVAENERVSLVVDHYSEDWTQLRFTMVEGTARLRELQAAELEALRAKYPQYVTMRPHWCLALTPARSVSWP